MDQFFNHLMVWLYRLTHGGRIAGRTLLLTTTGRHSGKQRTVPLLFIRDGATYAVVGANAGREKMPGWFYNVQAHCGFKISFAGF